ncbi:MAG: acetyl-CoA synthetase [Alphaproteobacteria bacterium RIFCSPHIGHO2_12_FULL_66_14]|jgi:acyl-CoA synthetase (AMP-forming)/AMP-acid ligase II|nr:MAG: acetyl-CoA synthetase [Alphaproteobacteria bacterium RIFCSPHIGHO2_12_FULL_66_14]
MVTIKYDNQGDAISRDVPREAPALIDAGGNGSDRTYTYGDILRLSGAVARGLQKRGLKRGERVAIISANRAEFLLTFLGALQASLVAVPVNYKLPAETVAYIVDDCGARLVIGDDARLALAPQSVPKISFDSDFSSLLDDGPFTPAKMQPTEPAMFLYTSGSTGRPKGVVLSHYSHLWAISQRVRRPVSIGQRSLVAAPLYHMNGLAMCQTTLSHGDTIVLLPQFTTRGYIEAAARHRVAFLTSVPTMIAMMLRERELLTQSDLSAVEAVRMGSAPITQALIDQVRAVFPKAQISNGYGTTEAGPVVFGPHPKGIPQPELSTGYPHPDVQLRLVRDGREVQDEGELEMKCGALMTHYHKLPEVTARAITPDGYYRTSDVFRRDENGFFYFVGRVDDMFVCGGENIYPGEVETMLERHPGIHQAAVIAVPDDLKGHKPIAFVVKAPGAAVDEQAIKTYALANAPAYQHPRRVFFVDEMPLAGTNKIDKRVLARQIPTGGDIQR